MITLLFLLALPALAQPTKQEPIDFRDVWSSWSPDMRHAFVDGFVEGGSRAYLECFNHLSEVARQTVAKHTFVKYHSDILSDVVTNLYKDPANSFVTYGAMILIARDKLDGLDIEPELRYARIYERGYGEVRSREKQ